MLVVEFTYNRDPTGILVGLAERAIGHTGPAPLAHHVRIKCQFRIKGEQSGRWVGCESTPGTGVHMLDPIPWRDPCRGYTIPSSPGVERDIWDYLLAQCGKPYSWWAVWRTLWWGLTGRAEKFDSNAHGRFDCAVLILGALRAGGIDPCPGVPLIDISPTCLEAALLLLHSPDKD